MAALRPLLLRQSPLLFALFGFSLFLSFSLLPFDKLKPLGSEPELLGPCLFHLSPVAERVIQALSGHLTLGREEKLCLPVVSEPSRGLSASIQSSPPMASKSSPVEPQSHRTPALPQSNYVRMSVGTSNQQRPTPQIRNGVVIPAMIPSHGQIQSIKTHSSRKQQPILSGLPKKIYDLSSLLQMSSSESIPETEPMSPSLTTNSSTSSHVSQLLSLLPRKRRRRRRRRHSAGLNAESEEGFDDDDESSPEDEDRVIPRRKPILKRGDETSHLFRDEREEYEKKRDERLAHYKLVDAFELHTEEVLWI